MCLKELVEFLKKHNPNKICKIGFHNPHSYRGYYEDVAFEPTTNITIREMLKAVKGAIGSTYIAWKGGEYTMSKYTQCWISLEGNNSQQSIGYLLMGFIVGEIK